MNQPSSASALSAGFVPLRLADRPLAVRAAAMVLGVAFLTLASWVQVPMFPVPMTLQTFAVLSVGALYGWRMGAATIALWLGMSFMGAPLLSEFKAGPAVFMGTTAGYLAGFVLAGALVGWLAERGWTRNIVPSLAAMLAGEALIMGLGVAWLATLIGFDKAVEFGFVPFILGDVLKLGIAALGLPFLARFRRKG